MSTEQSDTSADIVDTGDVISASSLANEKGGFGCASVGVGGVITVWIASFAIGFRRRDELHPDQD